MLIVTMNSHNNMYKQHKDINNNNDNDNDTDNDNDDNIHVAVII